MSGQRSPDARAAAVRAQRAALTVFLSVFAASWLIVGSLLAPVVAGGWGTIALAALAFTVIPLVFLLRSRGSEHYPGKAARLLVFRPMWYVQLLLILSALAGLVGIVAEMPFGAGARGGQYAIAAITAAYVLFALLGYAGSRGLLVASLTATIPSLPEALDGLRIAQICDTHIGPHTSRATLARIASAVRNAKPDLIAVVGDLIDDFAPDVSHYANAFGALAAPLGVYIVPGNHEVYAGWSEVLPRLRALAHVTLVNESRVVEHNGVRLAIAGTGDPAAGRIPGPGAPAPDIAATLGGIPKGVFTIVLAHNPALWPPLASAGVPLTLSGHTHWGQLSINGAGWSVANLFLELAMGAYRRGDSLLYVSPGTNYWGIPFRIGARAECSVITLRRGAEAGISGAQSADARATRARG
ncbi:MAG: metallophosphoesterase [Gemmatimonadota bacterium]